MMKRDKFFYGQASLFYCILFIIAIFISFCSNAQAEENYIWLQQSDIKYSEDGSAFCEVVLKKGTADLQVMNTIFYRRSVYIDSAAVIKARK